MQDKEKHLLHRDVQDALELISGRWRGAIMASLCGSPNEVFLQQMPCFMPILNTAAVSGLSFCSFVTGQ
jgi:hypothetical protein